MASLLQVSLDLSIFLLFCSATAVLYRWVFPRFVFSARVLASSFLAAEALAIVMGETFEPPTAFLRWFWHLDTEWNFASTLAATQLSLVGALALCIAWLSIKRPFWQRVYFVAVAAFFFFLGYDEFFAIHERSINWELVYIVPGAALTVIMAVIYWRSSRLEKLFAACIPIGLTLAAIGALLFDIFELRCGSWGFIFVFGQCMKLYIMEEFLEFLGVWVALLGVLGLFSNLSPPPNSLYRRALYALPVFLIIVLCSGGAVVPISQHSVNGADASVQGTGVQLHGYNIENGIQSVRIHLFLSPSGLSFNGQGYSITLIDQDSGNVYAGLDAHASKKLNFVLAPGYIPVWRQWQELQIPPATPRNRAMWVVLTFWREADGDFTSQKILSSDHPLLNDSQVLLDELVLRAPVALPADYKPLAQFDGGYKLAAAELPPRIKAGEALSVTFDWRANAPDLEDWAQFLHLGHVESGHWWVFDQQPLGDRLPTRLWYDGLADSETWTVSLPEDLPAGEYQVFTGLYRLEDQTRLIARDASGNPFTDSAAPLGNLLILNPNSE